MKTVTTASAITGGVMFLIVVASLIAPIFNWNPWGSAQNLFCGVGVLLVTGAVLLGVGVVGAEMQSRNQPPDDDHFYRK